MISPYLRISQLIYLSRSLFTRILLSSLLEFTRQCVVTFFNTHDRKLVKTALNFHLGKIMKAIVHSANHIIITSQYKYIFI